MGIVETVELDISKVLQKGIVAAGTAAAGFASTLLMKHFGVQMDVGQQAAISVAVTGALGALRNVLKQKVSWLGWL